MKKKNDFFYRELQKSVESKDGAEHINYLLPTSTALEQQDSVPESQM